MNRPLKLLFLKIISRFCIVIFTLASIEVFLWVFFPIPLEHEIEYRMSQDIPGLKSEVLYQRNIYGFRSNTMKTKEPPKNTYRIICIGASTTNQATQNMEDTWAGILEFELRKEFKEYGINIEVASYGRGGETIMDQCIWAWENLSKFNPNLLISLEGINDLCWHGGPEYKYKKLDIQSGDFKGPVINSIKISFKNKCLRYSQICRGAKMLKDILKTKYLKRKGKIIEWHTKNLPDLREKYRSLPYIPNPKRKPDPIEEFSDGMFILAKIVENAKIDLLILGQPVIWKRQMTDEELNSLWFYINTSSGPVRPSPTWLVNEIERYNKVQMRTAEYFNFCYVNLNEKIPKNLYSFFDDCHFTDLGSKLVANEIFPYVKKYVVKFLNHKKKIQNIDKKNILYPH